MAIRKEQFGHSRYTPVKPEEVQRCWFVEGKIRQAVAVQQHEDAISGPASSATAWELMRSFAINPIFAQLKGKATNELLVPELGKSYEKESAHVVQRLLPALFQYLAEYCIRNDLLRDRKKSDQSGRLLSYAKTMDVYQGLYPQAQRIPHLFGLDGLEGITPPDAIEVEETSRPLITKMYEMTSSQTPVVEHFQKAVAGFEMDLRNRGVYFRDDVQLIYVVPYGAKALLKHQLKLEGVEIPPDVDIAEIPFTHGEVYKEFKQILFEGKSDSAIDSLNPNTATLRDVIEEAHHQHARALSSRRENGRKHFPEMLDLRQRLLKRRQKQTEASA